MPSTARQRSGDKSGAWIAAALADDNQLVALVYPDQRLNRTNVITQQPAGDYRPGQSG